MNIYELEVLKLIASVDYSNQRFIAEATSFSLGKVNEAIKSLVKKGYLASDFHLTKQAKDFLRRSRPDSAIILAAGFGLRMIPINNEVPKALLEINGEILIERLLKQLHAVGVTNIYIVVGFQKDKFEFLIDKYNVELIYNPSYVTKNNLSSLELVSDKISNSYIIPGDIWSKENPFSKYELYSWYLISEELEAESNIKLNRQRKLVTIKSNKLGQKMLGIAYLLGKNVIDLKLRLNELVRNENYNNEFWEKALFSFKYSEPIYGKLTKPETVYEINTYEQLRELDNSSKNLLSKTVKLISREMKIPTSDILNISLLKQGMTNHSFKFKVNADTFIMRLPGEGTEKLINRSQEYQVYQVIKSAELSDEVIYIDPKSGIKISKFIENARVSDPFKKSDVKAVMAKLREFHNMKLQVDHSFDVFEKIEYYEKLWQGEKSIFLDYQTTKNNIWKLKKVIAQFPKEWVLTHIDAVPDNFIFADDRIYLIDWEYAAMQDPHLDIAMFAIYSLYNKKQVDSLIDAYFIEGCSKDNRIKIYAYIAMCGLLWSNWCEYKRTYGVEFGEYSLRQYRYAKDFYKLLKSEFVGL